MTRRWVALAVFALGCESIADIEDRHFEPGITGSPQCESYCNLVTACTGPLAAYPNRDLCILTCGVLPSGEVDKDNSLECRTTQAESAPSEPQFYCAGAGPFGANKCGSTCDAYCTLVNAFCPTALEDVDCPTACGALRHDGIYDFQQLTSGDTVECRVAYAVRASKDPDTWCPGAAPKSLAGPTGASCADPADGAPECADFCKLAQAACTGSNLAFESEAQCLAVCAFLDKGKNSDTVENTVGCRKYHSYNALSGPASHCPHAGPAGDGHCGTTCDSYCALLEKTCPSEFATLSNCQTECAGLPGADDDTFFKAAATGNTMRCRMTNAARAAEKTVELSAHCGAAIGAAGSQCAP